MNRNIIFVLILLITLSIVNAIPHQKHDKKKITSFDKCPDNDSDTVTVKVTVSPDPIVPNKNSTFTISGTLKHDLKSYSQIFVDFFTQNNSPIGLTYTGGICGDSCPPAGTEFNAKVEFIAPEDLPKSPKEYQAWVLVGNPLFTPDDGTFGCAAHNPFSK